MYRVECVDIWGQVRIMRFLSLLYIYYRILAEAVGKRFWPSNVGR